MMANVEANRWTHVWGAMGKITLLEFMQQLRTQGLILYEIYHHFQPGYGISGLV
jgi:hypothetical protein